MSILNENPRIALDNFVEFMIDDRELAKYIKQTALQTIKYLNGGAQEREALRDGQILERVWYDSLHAGTPDYSVYDSAYYLAELWACWAVYSRKYLTIIQSPKSLDSGSIFQSLESVSSVLDLGCGFGLTTAALKELFPSAQVTGTNLEDTTQYHVAKRLSERNGFSVVSSLQTLERVDLVFASEYFEHILNPLDHLDEVLRLQPRYLLIANSFNTKAIGHFEQYQDRGKSIDRAEISRMFNTVLRMYGYIKVKTHLWNNRPSFWIKRKDEIDQ